MANITIIQLGRYGDILTMLPIAKDLYDKGNIITWVVSKQFANLLEGIDYIKVHIFDGQPVNLLDAIELGKSIGGIQLITQIDRNPIKWTPTKNYQHEMWERAGYTNANKLALLLNNRNQQREQAAWASLQLNRPILVINLKSYSSPYKPQIMYNLLTKFTNIYNIIDISTLKLSYIIDILWILERAKLLISVDTSSLHFAYATGTPTIALVNDNPWLASTRRPNWIEAITYADSVKLNKCSTIINLLRHYST